MRTLSTYEIIEIVYFEYVKKIPLLRMIIMPILIIMIIARYMEVKVTELVQAASIEFGFDTGHHIFLKYMIIAVLSSLLIELQGFIFCSAVQRAYRNAIRNAVSDYLILDYSNFKQKGLGEITSNIDRQSNAISEILDVFILNLLPVCFVLTLAVLKIYMIMGTLSSLIITVSLICYTIITIKMAVWRNEIRKRLNLSVNDSKDKLMDILTNYDSIVAFNNQNYELHKYDIELKRNENHYVKLWRTFYLLNFLQRLIFCIQTGMIIYIGLIYQITPDQFVLYLSISKVLSANLDKLGYMYSRFTSSIINAKMSFLDIRKKKQLYPLQYFNKKITFKNVGVSLKSSNNFDFFSYENKSEFIFRNLNFQILKGEKIALVGFNGVGKSNFLKTLLKFNSYVGSIRIDEDELSTIDNDSLRQFISYIPQDSFLLSGTVKENLKYGNALVTDSEMVEMCKSLGFDESFRKLTAGYETFIGKNNSVLSGGEKQKIAIVRSLLKKADIYLFDEPTANLDRKSEMLFFKMLLSNENTKTTIVIVHNLDLLEHFDRILFLSKNGIEDIDYKKAISLINQKKEIH